MKISIWMLLAMLFVLVGCEEPSVYDSVGQTISYKAKIEYSMTASESCGKGCQRTNLAFRVFDNDSVYICLADTTLYMTPFAHKESAPLKGEIEGLRYWKGRDFAGYEIRKLNDHSNLSIPLLRCEQET